MSSQSDLERFRSDVASLLFPLDAEASQARYLPEHKTMWLKGGSPLLKPEQYRMMYDDIKTCSNRITEYAHSLGISRETTSALIKQHTSLVDYLKITSSLAEDSGYRADALRTAVQADMNHPDLFQTIRGSHRDTKEWALISATIAAARYHASQMSLYPAQRVHYHDWLRNELQSTWDTFPRPDFNAFVPSSQATSSLSQPQRPLPDFTFGSGDMGSFSQS